VEAGIDLISLSPDSVIDVKRSIAQLEDKVAEKVAEDPDTWPSTIE
jgi:hypothetical protein